jgi:hypothetical protein
MQGAAAIYYTVGETITIRASLRLSLILCAMRVKLPFYQNTLFGCIGAVPLFQRAARPLLRKVRQLQLAILHAQDGHALADSLSTWMMRHSGSKRQASDKPKQKLPVRC